MNPAIWERNSILDLLLECGRIGLHYFRQNEWQLKPDGTLITRADTEIEALLARHLDCPDAGAYLIGEESVCTKDDAYLSRAMAGTAWVVDPIDGTAPYAHGLPHWGTSIALMDSGRLSAGGMILPASGEIFLTDADAETVHWSASVLRKKGNEAVELRPLVPRRQPFTEGGMIAVGQEFAKKRSVPLNNPIQAPGCAIHVLAYLLLGRFMAYIGHMKLWDLAAGLPMLLSNGYEARLLNGLRLTEYVSDSAFSLTQDAGDRWSLRDTCIFAPQGVGAQLLQRLGPGATVCCD